MILVLGELKYLIGIYIFSLDFMYILKFYFNFEDFGFRLDNEFFLI